MPINLKSASDFWGRIFGDSATAGDGTSSSTPARFDQFNQDIGQANTTVSVDGDLRNIDSAAERLSIAPTENNSGSASTRYTTNFLLRWITSLNQDVLVRLPGSLGQKSKANSLAVVLPSDQDPVPVSGTITANTGLSQPLTDTQLRATAVPVSGSVTANAGTGTMAVSAASLPLPTGAATAANQATANTSLSSLDTKIPALGQALAAASTPVVLPATQISALTPPSTVGISGSLPAGTNAIGSITNTAFTANAGTGTFATNLGQIAGTATSVNAGTVDAGTQRVTLASDGPAVTRLGDITETAPATDTASSGLNGRLQRIAQRLTSLIALFPSSIGQKNKAGSLSVAWASDQLGAAGTPSSDVISIQGITSMTPIAVSGTVTANTGLSQPLTDTQLRATAVPVSLASLPALATGSNTVGKVRITDGTNDATLLNLTNSKPIPTAIVDATGNQITSFGGGTQYADGTTQATPTGSVSLWLDGSVLRAPSAAKPLPVSEIKKTFICYRNTALSSTKQEIKATAGDVYGWNFINPNTVDVFVKIYDAPAASVTVGTTTPTLTLQIPAASSSSFGNFWQDVGLAPQEIFTSGITIAVVTGLADNSTTAPTTPIHGSVRFI